MAVAEASRGRILGLAGLASLPVGLILLPVVPGLILFLAPAMTGSGLERLVMDPQMPDALAATLLSTGLSLVLALALAIAAAASLYPGPGWPRFRVLLPGLVALPHLAFAIGLAFLLQPSGLPMRFAALFAGWESPPETGLPRDQFGLVLGVALGLKEALFLLFVMAGMLAEPRLQGMIRVAESLGYCRLAIWRQVILPVLLPRLAWPMLAVLAYSLSVVDMALVLGPSNPPTLAVLATVQIADPDPALAAQGAAAALLLLVMMVPAGFGLVALLRSAGRMRDTASGERGRIPQGAFSFVPALLAGLPVLVLGLTVLWAFARAWFWPALLPGALTLDHVMAAGFPGLWETVIIAALSSALGLAAALVWLEWGPRRFDALIALPLILPALGVAAGQYRVTLMLGLEGTILATAWAHLFLVLPYMVIILSGPFAAIDGRLERIAASLGAGRLSTAVLVRWPTLALPALTAFAVGFAVSVAQYLPTLFVGAGRISTVTTETMATAAGASRSAAAVAALEQALLPALALVGATFAMMAVSRFRRGLG